MTRHDNRISHISRGANSARTNEHLRLRIAQASAKLIAEGLTDYHAAKIKAARQLNCVDKSALPDNHEIEAALREHLALFAGAFAGNTQPEALAALRHVALRAMRWLQIEASALAQDHEPPFEPWLTGAVLNGTANEFSEIELEIVGVESKTIEFILLNRGVEFELRTLEKTNKTARHSAKSKSTKTFKPTASDHSIQYHLEFESAPLVITLFDNHAQRQALYPRGSIKEERVQYDAAIALFEGANLKHSKL